MTPNYSTLNLEQLQLIHERMDKELQTAMLNGSPWEEIRDKMADLAELAKIIHRRKYPLDHPGSTPADKAFRE